VDGAGGVEGFLRGAVRESGAQDGVFVAVAGARVPNGRSPSIDRTTGAGPPRAAACNKWRGAHRQTTERTIALLHWFRRLRIRWEIRDGIHEAFMTLAAAIICWRHLTR
jgi:hypothetical protein